MKFLDKIKDLFTDEEEEVEEREVEVVEDQNHQLPTFMRNKIEEEKREEEKKKESIPESSILTSDREIVRTRNQNNFSFPIDMDEETPSQFNNSYSSQNVLLKEREKSVSELYTKKEEPKPRKFKPTPVISPVYGVLDKNYTKDEVKVQDTSSYEIQRPSRKIDFETVRNKAFGNLTDDIKNNLCENCELYQEVKITKNADQLAKKDNLLSNMIDDDVSLGTAEENFFDFGVSYEPPKKDEDVTIMHADKVEINGNIENEIKIINHNDEDSKAEKIEVKEIEEEPKISSESIPDNSDDDILSKLSHDEEDITSILKDNNEESENEDNDIFNLIDSMYDEEEEK